MWNRKLNEFKRQGRQLWNGKVYTCESILALDDAKVMINMGLCEYKDIIVNRELGTEFMFEKFALEALSKHCSVQTSPITEDGYHVLGKATGQTLQEAGNIGLIGGTLNENEMKVDNLEDIYTFLEKEIKEELGLDSSTIDSRVLGIGFFEGRFGFNYYCRLSYSREELINIVELSDEFAELVFFKPEDFVHLAQSYQLRPAVINFFECL